MSDNNAGYNDSDQDNYYASNNSTQADFGQFQDGRNQPAAQPYNPNPYASQQPAQPAQPFYGQPTYGQPDYTQSAQPPYYQQQAQPRYEQPSYNQPPIYAQQTYYQAAQQQPGYGYAQKSKIVAGLLGLFLGGLGVHNFYLGYTGKAVAQLLLTLIGWIILIGPIISGIWALIESVLILCSSYGSNWHRDGRGQELQD
ncbi:TM2 domain-containing protein [Bifidobacterium catenulatum]|uniref:TM2 domain-containing protein n=1 Tax=Bifidobacterium catenulatum TaxID=1686 RepID=UPI0034A36D5E